MNTFRRITQVFNKAEIIPFDDNSKFVLMSDCHRGNGSSADDFVKNKLLYLTALKHYYNNKYTYIEIGDGDELWKNKKMSDIVEVHRDVFWFLSKLYKEGRLYFIYGNHDLAKQDEKYVKNNLYSYYDPREKRSIPLFKNIKIHEGLVLEHKQLGYKILLVHGHQGDFINDRFWKLGRFLVRYLWGPLSSIGINDPTSVSKDYYKKEAVERKLIEWVQKNKHMLIAGHTHRSMFPDAGEIPYFNDGSSVHPRCITAIEISKGSIELVKWNVQTKDDGSVFVGREVLAGPKSLKDYFDEAYRTLNEK